MSTGWAGRDRGRGTGRRVYLPALTSPPESKPRVSRLTNCSPQVLWKFWYFLKWVTRLCGPWLLLSFFFCSVAVLSTPHPNPAPNHSPSICTSARELPTTPSQHTFARERSELLALSEHSAYALPLFVLFGEILLFLTISVDLSRVSLPSQSFPLTLKKPPSLIPVSHYKYLIIYAASVISPTWGT